MTDEGPESKEKAERFKSITSHLSASRFVF